MMTGGLLVLPFSVSSGDDEGMSFLHLVYIVLFLLGKVL